MFSDCTYDKIKLLHEMSSLVWFIEKHALPDAQKASDEECITILTSLHGDLKKHLEELQTHLGLTCE